VKKWIARWNAYWFPTTTTTALALTRIIAVAAQLFWFFPSLRYQLNLLEKNSEFIEPQLLIRAITAVVPRDLLFTPSGFSVFYWVTVIAGLAALVGLFTRTSLFVFALGSWILVAHAYSYADIHHTQAVYDIFLMALAFSPAGASLSLDAFIRRRRARTSGASAEAPRTTDTAMWPLKLAHVLLAMTYFSTGVTKLLAGGFRWMNGYTLQAYAFEDAIRRELPVGIWLGQHHTLCLLLSIFTILFETFFFPRAAPFFFINGLFFQIGLYVAAGHPFFQHMVLLLLLLLFIAPPWWRAWLGKYLDPYLARWRGQAQAPQPL
jgi:hypothetical protein